MISCFTQNWAMDTHNMTWWLPSLISSCDSNITTQKEDVSEKLSFGPVLIDLPYKAFQLPHGGILEPSGLPCIMSLSCKSTPTPVMSFSTPYTSLEIQTNLWSYRFLFVIKVLSLPAVSMKLTSPSEIMSGAMLSKFRKVLISTVGFHDINHIIWGSYMIYYWFI